MIDKKIVDQLTAAIKTYNHIDIFIKGSPDPDAMASSFALKVICELVGTRATIYTLEKITFHQNIQFSKKLKLPIQKNKPGNHRGKATAYAIMDHQSIQVDGVSGDIPCAIHIDHHDKINQKDRVDFQIINPKSGSTCTIMTFLIKHLESRIRMSTRIKRRVFSALYFGIQTDTTDFKFATAGDREARQYLTPFVDFYLIETLSQMPFPREMIKIINRAITECIVQNNWAIVGLGFIVRKNRDVLPMIADELLKKKDVLHSSAYALITEKHHLVLEASFRSRVKTFNLNRMIKSITKSGGGRNYKGAFQIPMDFFLFCEDKETLWKMVSDTTMCAIRQRGGKPTPDIIGKLSKTIRKNLLDLFRK